MGKLSEKLGLSHDKALSYYAKAIALNPSAVDSIYRMHASRLKFLGKCGKGDLQALKVCSIKSYKVLIVACFEFIILVFVINFQQSTNTHEFLFHVILLDFRYLANYG